MNFARTPRQRHPETADRSQSGAENRRSGMIGAPVEPEVAKHLDPLQLAAGQRTADCAAGEVPLTAGGGVSKRDRCGVGSGEEIGRRAVDRSRKGANGLAV